MRESKCKKRNSDIFVFLSFFALFFSFAFFLMTVEAVSGTTRRGRKGKEKGDEVSFCFIEIELFLSDISRHSFYLSTRFNKLLDDQWAVMIFDKHGGKISCHLYALYKKKNNAYIHA
jgi:hypothetical protein